MSSREKIVLLLLLLVNFDAAEKLPPYLIKCTSRDPAKFKPCVLDNAQRAMTYLGKQGGDKKFGLSSSDPVYFPLIETDNNGFKLKFIDMKIQTDPPNAYVVNDADMDLERRHIDFSYFAPAINMISKYETSGRILVLPVKGEGDAVIRLDNYQAKFSADFDVEKNAKDGLDYIKLKNTKFNGEVSKVTHNFTNLFNGDQTLGKATNDFLNENWKDVFDETKWSTFEAVRQLATVQLQNFFNRVPYNEAFPE